MTERLTREQIDAVLAGMTAADLIENIGDGVQGAKIAGNAFDTAAARQGFTNGTRAVELVGVADFQYLVTRLNEVMNLGTPLPEEQEGSQDSVATGE